MNVKKTVGVGMERRRDGGGGGGGKGRGGGQRGEGSVLGREGTRLRRGGRGWEEGGDGVEPPAEEAGVGLVSVGKLKGCPKAPHWQKLRTRANPIRVRRRLQHSGVQC